MSGPMEDSLDFDPRRSLLALEGEDWDPTCFDDAVQRLCTKPLRKLLPGELLYLIQVAAGLRFTIPMALALLEEAPFLQAATHPGDLLVAVLESSPAHWAQDYPGWLRTIAILETAVAHVQQQTASDETETYLPNYLGDDFMTALLHFRSLHPGT